MLLFAFHGATFLTLRTNGELCERAAARGPAARPARGVGVAALLAWTVAVAVDRNDKDVFPPRAPGRARRRWRSLLAVVFVFGAPQRLGVRR